MTLPSCLQSALKAKGLSNSPVKFTELLKKGRIDTILQAEKAQTGKSNPNNNDENFYKDDNFHNY